jgi:predicted MPP superfamily phosphohydrolase
MEAAGVNFGPDGRRPLDNRFLARLLPLVERGAAALGLARAGRRNALGVRLREAELAFPDLPPAFDGYRLLHLTDLHLDAHPDLLPAVLAAVPRADLVVATGDYVFGHAAAPPGVARGLAAILRRAAPADGGFATLGNHDRAGTADALEAAGWRHLANESAVVERGGDRLVVTGVDDVRRFHTPAADAALAARPRGFGIAAVHSPDMAAAAAAAGCALYLCGHTHWGQIALPGGVPILAGTADRGRASGFWRHGGMLGWTGPGTGFSGAPLRFFTRSEATLFILRRARRTHC